MLYNFLLKQCFIFLLFSAITQLTHANTVTKGSGQATLNTTKTWSSGYCTKVVITNQGTKTISDWDVTVKLNGGKINKSWSSNRKDNVFTPKGSNKNIKPKDSKSFGFCVSTKTPDKKAVISAINITGGDTVKKTKDAKKDKEIVKKDNQAAAKKPNNSTNSDRSEKKEALGCDGHLTRYWDCCKPHCAWSGNTPAGVDPLPSCAVKSKRLTDINAVSSCDSGDGHMCHDLAPWKVNNSLSYGFAATPAGDVCGRCYEVEFTGVSHNAPADPGSQAIKGKRMIVQATNIGYDVESGQFDLLIPGGGVGAFNACSKQWGVSDKDLGKQYGGFLQSCREKLNYTGTHAEHKQCVIEQCDKVFGTRGLTELQNGCRWFADWYEVADNPEVKYREVKCPEAIVKRSGVDRRDLNDIVKSCF